MAPVVSVIVACFNKSAYLAETIKSIQVQTLSGWELIIIDDCSTDESLNIIRTASEGDARIKYVANECNRGANYCRNLGIEKASAEYLIFLDADDLLSNTCLELRVEFMNIHKDLHCAVFPMQLFRHKIGDMRTAWIPRKRRALERFLSHDLPWAIMQPIWKTNYVRSIGGMDEAFTRLEDVDFHTRALLNLDFRFQIVGSNFDCYYRIVETRKVFNSFEFLRRTCVSASLYFSKYHKIPLVSKSRNLSLGTIYSAYYALLQNFRNKRITKSQFTELESILFTEHVEFCLTFGHRCIFKFARIYHLYFVRVPGINRALFKMLTF